MLPAYDSPRALQDPISAEWERLDPAFAKVDGDEFLERIFTAGRWLEGPTYFPAGRYLVFSNIPNNRILRWVETTGTVGVFRSPPTTPTGTPATGPDGWSPASRAAGASCAPSTTAR
jgi:gluconolactonase